MPGKLSRPICLIGNKARGMPTDPCFDESLSLKEAMTRDPSDGAGNAAMQEQMKAQQTDKKGTTGWEDQAALRSLLGLEPREGEHAGLKTEQRMAEAGGCETDAKAIIDPKFCKDKK